ncbi:MAG: hypothetical protein J5I52_10600 [Saprospiraceae bacterium]|nr:MAG: hypothetical protein UZ09_BCD002000537 [Bacteroidetes bacterium OLB9]MCO6464582.1 hypothetical protein [Saprospiraceae bacterium]MCZ2337768.1 hypothetical protein [Chitinophagales bacterium]
MIGGEKDMLFSKETIGHVSIVVDEQHKFIIQDMQKETLEKNQSNGLFQFVKIVMINYIEKTKVERTINGHITHCTTSLLKKIAKNQPFQR